ncbi:MAG: DUF4339 domain-containing protein, partial [Pirellulales bacterium]|nr:DUF4339 domain-containing protein [Pirellulales bacterium]
MGIRFNCPACDRALNVKEEQAGKRGICPYCKGKIEIPAVSTQRQGADASAPAPSAAAMPARSSDAAAGPPGSFHLAASDAAASRGEEASVAAGGQTASRTQATPPEGAAAGMRQAQEAVPAAGTAAISPGTASAVPSPAAVPPAAGPAADPIATAPQLRWYVVPPGSTSQYGPASGSELAAWIQQNRVPPESLVWREDWPEWQVAGRVLPQLGGVGGSLPAARQPTVVLPLAPGHLPTAAGPAPLAA